MHTEPLLGPRTHRTGAVGQHSLPRPPFLVFQRSEGLTPLDAAPDNPDTTVLLGLPQSPPPGLVQQFLGCFARRTIHPLMQHAAASGLDPNAPHDGQQRIQALR